MSAPADTPAGRPRGRHWYVAALATALAAAAMAVFTTVVLAAAYRERARSDPWQSAELEQLREQIERRPLDRELVERYRQLDVRLREAYFRADHRVAWGRPLLLAELGVLAAAGLAAAGMRLRLPEFTVAGDPRAEEERHATAGRWAVAVLAALLLAGGVVLALRWRVPGPLREAPSTRPAGGAGAGSVSWS